jgi:LPXTG-motif cell wall-anchored protein
MRSSSLAAGAAVFAVAVLGTVPAMAASPVEDASTPMCASSQLTAALGGGDAGAGNLYRYLVLTNSSATACHLTGYPGLSMLDASGKQIGRPATRQPTTYAAVVLKPGASASDTIHTINHQGTCLPVSSKLKIYPPGNTASLTIAGQITNCDNLFSITPLVAGKGGNPSNTPTSAPTTPAPTSSASSGGQQVTTVPSGAPDTGLATTGSHGSDTAAVAGTAAGVLAVGAAGVALMRRRKVRAER